MTKPGDPANGWVEPLSAEAVIALLGLAPHPEGGWFRETFRDQKGSGTPLRAHGTAIHFLLAEGQVSRWHRVDAVEIWHWYRGAALDLGLAAPGATEVTRHRLGNRIEAGEHPQIVVPAGWWQQARSLGAWTLVGCTVAPGFSFD